MSTVSLLDLQQLIVTATTVQVFHNVFKQVQHYNNKIMQFLWSVWRGG